MSDDEIEQLLRALGINAGDVVYIGFYPDATEEVHDDNPAVYELTPALPTLNDVIH